MGGAHPARGRRGVLPAEGILSPAPGPLGAPTKGPMTRTTEQADSANPLAAIDVAGINRYGVGLAPTPRPDLSDPTAGSVGLTCPQPPSTSVAEWGAQTGLDSGEPRCLR